MWAIVAGGLLYIGGTVWAGFTEVAEELLGFHWGYYVLVLLLTLVNYGLRFGKWEYLLRRLGVSVPLKDNLTIYLAGMAMVISPGKAGELLKPFLVSRRTGVPMATTLPALVAERLTDGVAMLMLAAISVSTYAADQTWVLWLLGGCTAAALLVLAVKPVSLGVLGVLQRLPLIGRFVPKLREMYLAMRICLAPVPFLLTTAVSLVAWGAECLGYLLVFEGLGVTEASLDSSTFLYAFATVAGGFMPGGLGVADGALVGGAVEIMGTTQASAVAASLLIRVATLWFGVLLGAVALLRFESLLEHGIEVDDGASSDSSESQE